MRRAFWTAGLVAGLAAARDRRRRGSSVALSQLPMKFLRRLLARVRAWNVARDAARAPASLTFYDFMEFRQAIHRDVSSQGVRVFSLCGACGARLQASATLCNECAQKKSRPARPY